MPLNKTSHIRFPNPFFFKLKAPTRHFEYGLCIRTVGQHISGAALGNKPFAAGLWIIHRICDSKKAVLAAFGDLHSFHFKVVAFKGFAVPKPPGHGVMR